MSYSSGSEREKVGAQPLSQPGNGSLICLSDQTNGQFRARSGPEGTTATEASFKEWLAGGV